MSQPVIGPTSHMYYSQRLRLHYVDWGNEDAPPMLLVHGGRDHCRNWDWVAQEFRDEYHVIAPDLRGHGDSDWAVGGTYGLFDFVADIAQLVHQKQLAPVTILSHSLGGNVSLHFAGLYPEAVKRLVAIEGSGQARRCSPSGRTPQSRAPRRLDRDIAKAVRTYAPQVSDARGRTDSHAGGNPHLSAEQARHLTIHGSAQNEDGTYSWKFDNTCERFLPCTCPRTRPMRCTAASPARPCSSAGLKAGRRIRSPTDAQATSPMRAWRTSSRPATGSITINWMYSCA